MRKSKEATAESRRRLVEAAARLLRESGVEGASIANVCEAVGMTHGAFYKHFDSKDALLAEAAAAAFGDLTELFDSRAAAIGEAAAVAAYVEDYLSDGHVAHPERGCPVAAFGAEAGRRPEALAEAFGQGVEALISRAAGGGSREAAIARLATLVGAVVTARAVGEGPLRSEIVAAARRAMQEGR